MAENKICEGDHIVDHVVKVTDPSVEEYVLYTAFESLKRTVTFSNENKTNPKQNNIEKDSFANLLVPSSKRFNSCKTVLRLGTQDLSTDEHLPSRGVQRWSFHDVYVCFLLFSWGNAIKTRAFPFSVSGSCLVVFPNHFNLNSPF